VLEKARAAAAQVGGQGDWAGQWGWAGSAAGCNPLLCAMPRGAMPRSAVLLAAPAVPDMPDLQSYAPLRFLLRPLFCRRL
jgi:hypothetical protein